LSRQTTLYDWNRKGCPHLDGTPLTVIREHGKNWYLLTEIERIKRSRSEFDKGTFGNGSDARLTLVAASRRYGWGCATLLKWESACPYLALGRLEAVYERSKRGPKTELRTYRVSDLDEIERILSASFDGTYQTEQGLAFNVDKAVKKFGISSKLLLQFRIK